MKRPSLLPILATLSAVAALVSIAGCPVTPTPTDTDTDPAEFTAASANRGGLLYDKWWNVASVTAPTTDHPLWASRPDTTTNTRTGSDTWRCKECHGWDYKGVSGAYSSGSHRTGIAGLFGTALGAQEIFDSIKTTHGFGTAGLSDDDIWDLAKFVVDGIIDTDTYIAADDSFIGSASNGETFFNNGIGGATSCSTCHGTDGTQINFKDPPDEEFVGTIAAGNPWEFLHKVRFGQPGSSMPATEVAGASVQDAADTGAHAATLQQ